MLNGKLTLHDIRDVEAFCQTIIDRTTHSPSWHEREDLLAYLVTTCWEISRTYKPGGITFSTYARTTLQKRVHDWTREHNGRTTWKTRDAVYTRELPTVYSLDAERNGNGSLHRSLSRPDRDADAVPQLLNERRRHRARHRRALRAGLLNRTAA